MQHHLGLRRFERTAHGSEIAHVGDMQRGAVAQRLGNSRSRCPAQVIQQRDLESARQQAIDKV